MPAALISISAVPKGRVASEEISLNDLRSDKSATRIAVSPLIVSDHDFNASSRLAIATTFTP